MLDTISSQKLKEYENIKQSEYNFVEQLKICFAKTLVGMIAFCSMPMMIYSLYFTLRSSHKKRPFVTKLPVLVYQIASKAERWYLRAYFHQTPAMENFLVEAAQQKFDLQIWFMAEGALYQAPHVKNVCRDVLGRLVKTPISASALPVRREQMTCLLSLIDLNNPEQLNLSLDILRYVSHIRSNQVAYLLQYLTEFEPKNSTQVTLQEMAEFSLAYYNRKPTQGEDSDPQINAKNKKVT